MMKRLLGFGFFLYSVSIAQDIPGPFYNLDTNLKECVSGYNLFYHASGVLTTYMLIQSGTDTGIHDYFVEKGYSAFFDPAVAMGYVMPVCLGAGLYLYGDLEKLKREKSAGSAVLQAGFISLAYTSILKAVSGRPNPDPYSYGGIDDASRKFRFGFLKGGIHYGWPSGHLCTNTAIVSSLTTFYPENNYLKFGGICYLGYLFYGVIAHENNTMHWFSDAVAGVIMGYAIGSTTGKNYRKKLDNKTDTAKHNLPGRKSGLMQFKNSTYILNITPVIFSGFRGLNLTIIY